MTEKNQINDQNHEKPKPQKTLEKERRLKKALQDNLRRRKEVVDSEQN